MKRRVFVDKSGILGPKRNISTLPKLESQYTLPTLYNIENTVTTNIGIYDLVYHYYYLYFLPWESLLWFPVEESPGPNSQADQLKAEGDQHPVTANSTLQLGVPKQQHY